MFMTAKVTTIDGYRVGHQASPHAVEARRARERLRGVKTMYCGTCRHWRRPAAKVLCGRGGTRGKAHADLSDDLSDPEHELSGGVTVPAGATAVLVTVPTSARVVCEGEVAAAADVHGGRGCWCAKGEGREHAGCPGGRLTVGPGLEAREGRAGAGSGESDARGGEVRRQQAWTQRQIRGRPGRRKISRPRQGPRQIEG